MPHVHGAELKFELRLPAGIIAIDSVIAGIPAWA